MEQPVVYDYLDYRAFLMDMFAYTKQQDRHFSHRFFARKAGFASPNFLKLVMGGQRNLTHESTAKIAKGFDLKKQNREFFENLVYMNQAGHHEEKNYYYRKMMTYKNSSSIRKLEKASYDYFSTWYYPVIREIVAMGERDHTPEGIAALLQPEITAKEAEKALAQLINLGLIHKDEQGRWVQTDKGLSTGPEVRSLVVANFHKEMIKLAGEAIDRYPSHERDITALTLSVPAAKIAEIKKRLAEFRRELLTLACEDEVTDQVIQINFQLFPLTKPKQIEEGV